MDFFREVTKFFIKRKKWWIIPPFVVLLLAGSLIVLTEGTIVAPFVYAMF